MRISLITTVSLITGSFVGAQMPGAFVTSGVGCPDDGTDIAAADDTVNGPHDLGFAFPYVGGVGSTTMIDIAPNGYIYFEPGTNTSSRCCSGASVAGVPIADFFSATPSLAAFGHDLNASATSGSGNGTIHFETDGVGVATISWQNVNDFGQDPVTPNTFQVQLLAGGTIIVDYTTLSATDEALVGYSEGGGVLDGGGSDLSMGASGVGGTAIYEVFFPFPGLEDLSGSSLIYTLNGAGSYDVSFAGPTTMPCCLVPLTLSAGDTPRVGETFTMDLTNIPGSTVASALLIGAINPNLPLDAIGATGCFLQTAIDIASPGFVGANPELTIPGNPGNAGLVFELQVATISPGVNMLGLALSNNGQMTIGDAVPNFAADGANTFNSDSSQGFFRFTNESGQNVVAMQLDFNAALPGKVFDTDQTGMADRFDGGNSVMAGCAGTYRNGSDVATGLNYGTTVSNCDAAAFTGWVGSNPGVANSFQTLDFTFSDFNNGETFEFDTDTDGAGTGGDDMAGMVVTITLADTTVISGSVVALGADLGGVQL